MTDFERWGICGAGIINPGGIKDFNFSEKNNKKKHTIFKKKYTKIKLSFLDLSRCGSYLRNNYVKKVLENLQNIEIEV